MIISWKSVCLYILYIKVSLIMRFLEFARICTLSMFLDFREMYFHRKWYVNSQTYRCLLSIYNTHPFPLLKCFRIHERLWGTFWHRRSVLWLQSLVLLCDHLTYMSWSSTVLLFSFGFSTVWTCYTENSFIVHIVNTILWFCTVL